MAIRKKNTAESETLRAEESAKAAQKSSRTRKTAAAEAAGASDNKASRTQSPAAATHKAPARKTVQTAAAAAGAGSAVAEAKAFDVALHHEEIRTEAYHVWVRNGYQPDSEHRDWLAAIEIVRSRHEK